jgi:hypothetical protein
MTRTAVRSFAALLVAAAVAMPGSVFAAPDQMPTEKPVPEAPAPAPDQNPKDKPVLAEVKITKEQAIEIAKQTFVIPDDMNAPNGGLSQSTGGAAWRLDWQSPSKSATRIYINVQIDAVTGAILGYSRSSNQPASVADLKYSRSEAFKLASDWVEKLAADKKGALRYTDDPLSYGFWGGSTTYHFHWDRLEQGYPMNGQGLDVVIDARDGSLSSFGTNWLNNPDLTYTLPEKILDRAAAEEAFRTQATYGLYYQRFQQPGADQGDWRLIYRPMGGFFPSVNQQGQLIDGSGKPIDFATWTATKLVPKAEKPFTKPAKPITRDEAQAIAQAVAGRTDSPKNVDCSEYGEETKSLQCYFNWYTEGKNDNASVAVDLNTGLVSNYYHYVDWNPGQENTQPKVSQEKAREIALAFIQKYRPDMAGSALMNPPMDTRDVDLKYMRGWSISFTMLVNGVQLLNGSASVEVDVMTGEVNAFWGGMLQLDPKEPLPEATGLLRQTDISDSFLKNRGLELAWVVQYPQANPMMGKVPGGQAEAVKPTVALVWVPRNQMQADMFDAKTGVPYDYTGRNLIEAAKRPVDIEGHFAQKEIELLWARGIFELKDGKFMPDETATAGDLARWLVMARGLQPYPMYDYALNFTGRGGAAETIMKSAAAPYFGSALQNGIMMPEDFDEVSPDKPVSREMYALWVVRALGYGDIAKMPNKIEMPFADKAQIGAQFANAVAILNGLKIAQGDATTEFFPARMVTRGEAAKMLFAVAAQSRFFPYGK